MKRLSRISTNRALLVLCALGFLSASSGLVSAQDGRKSERGQGVATDDFDGVDYFRKMKSKEKKNKLVGRPGEQIDRAASKRARAAPTKLRFNADFDGDNLRKPKGGTLPKKR